MPFDPVQQAWVVASLGEFGEFEKISGGIPTTAFVEHTEAGARTPTHLPGTTSYTDLTLERAYRPGRDEAVVNWQKQFALGYEGPRTVTKQFRNFQGAVTGTETYAVCKPVSVETPEGVSGDNTVAMLKVVLKVTQKV